MLWNIDKSMLLRVDQYFCLIIISVENAALHRYVGQNSRKKVCLGPLQKLLEVVF